MYQVSLHGDSRFGIHVLKLTYDCGNKPKNLLLELGVIGWKENPLVRNPMMEMPGCAQEFAVCMDSKLYGSLVLDKTKRLLKQYNATLKVLSVAPKGKF